MRRPSPATVIALIALFVALGGPAQAMRLIDGKDIKKGTIRSAQVKDHSLSTRDLSRRAVRALKATPDGTITEAKIANAAVTTGKLGGAAVTAGKLAAASVGSVALADRSVTASKLAPASVGGDQVADGTLTTADVARGAGGLSLAGRFAVDMPEIGVGQCWSGEVQTLAPEQAGADISGDLVLVTPGRDFDQDRLTFTVRPSQTNPSRFVMAACNVGQPLTGGGPETVPPTRVGFRYAVFHIP